MGNQVIDKSTAVRAAVTFLFAAIILSLLPISSALAHRSGCHRWHSCPSDQGTTLRRIAKALKVKVGIC